MKNKKSPLKFLGGLAGALSSGNMVNMIGSYLGRGGGNMSRHTGGGGLGGQYAGVGSRPAQVTDASAQFNQPTINAMEGVYGNVNARQASVGSAGMMALKKHISPVNQGEELPQMDTTMGGTMPQDTSIEPGDKDYEAYARDTKTLENLKYTTDKNSLDITGKYDPNWTPTMEEDGYTLDNNGSPATHQVEEGEKHPPVGKTHRMSHAVMDARRIRRKKFKKKLIEENKTTK